jgi:hypothetical protein
MRKFEQSLRAGKLTLTETGAFERKNVMLKAFFCMSFIKHKNRKVNRAIKNNDIFKMLLLTQKEVLAN